MSAQRTISNSGPLGQLPTKWAVGVVVLLIVYALLQPQLNKRLGWSLPSLASMQQGDQAPAKDKPSPPPARSKPPAAEPNTAAENELQYGLLRETAPDDFLSPGGLRYTRGSDEGHRLTHIQRHLEDDPDRPGKHGVFDGDMPQVLRWLDEAYALGKRGAKGTKISEEDGRTVYEVSFSKPVGYIGGRDGGRSNHPDARRIRLVVDGNKVITAFPF